LPPAHRIANGYQVCFVVAIKSFDAFPVVYRHIIANCPVSSNGAHAAFHRRENAKAMRSG
jgi:hypothetical protein